VCEKEGEFYFAKIVEVLDNVYPCYSCNITWEIANCGTVPAFLGTWETNVIDCDSDLWKCVELKSWKITEPDGVTTWIGATWDGLWEKMQTIQVDECQTYTVEIEKHILQDCPDNGGFFECPQGANVTVEHELMFVQWNKIGEFLP
jgi:hypothetical protein